MPNLPPIDRLSPAKRPPGRTVMHQRWRHLLFLHWEVPAEALRSLVPRSLDVDTFEGRAFVGLVPFSMTGVRPSWTPPVWGLSTFLEVNVRTYVHQEGRNPGVWFFSLDAAQSLAVRFARRYWNLPYHRASMAMERDGSREITYHSKRLWPGPTPADCRMTYRPSGEPKASEPGSLEHFLAERYFLYAQRGTSLFRGQVHHRPYPLQPAEVDRLDEDMIAAAGIDRGDEAPLAHYSPGVKVRVYPLARVGPGVPKKQGTAGWAEP